MKRPILIFAALAFFAALPLAAQDIVVSDTNNHLIPHGATAADKVLLNRFTPTMFGQNSDRQFWILNDDVHEPLEILSVTITGTHAGDFQLLPQTTQMPHTIVALGENIATANLFLRFSPTELGERTALVTIEFTDPNDQVSVYTFTVAGICIGIEPLLPNLHVFPELPVAKMIKNNQLKVKGKVEVWNTGPLTVKGSTLELYHTTKRYLDETAQLIDIRRLKKARPMSGKGKLRVKRYRYTIKVPDPGVPTYHIFTGGVMAVVRPAKPTDEDAEWFGNGQMHHYFHPIQVEANK